MANPEFGVEWGLEKSKCHGGLIPSFQHYRSLDRGRRTPSATWPVRLPSIRRPAPVTAV